MKVYLVYSENYGDPSVVDVVSTKEAAEAYDDALDNCYYVEREVDGLAPPPPGMRSWTVRIAPDGAVWSVERSNRLPHTEASSFKGTFSAEAWARDAQHAIEIANERRTVALSTPMPRVQTIGTEDA
jgi:hypothetical protein